MRYVWGVREYKAISIMLFEFSSFQKHLLKSDLSLFEFVTTFMSMFRHHIFTLLIRLRFLEVWCTRRKLSFFVLLCCCQTWGGSLFLSCFHCLTSSKNKVFVAERRIYLQTSSKSLRNVCIVVSYCSFQNIWTNQICQIL